MTKRIKLSNCEKYTLVDDEDYEKFKQYRWCLHPNGYAQASVNKKAKLLHRVILNAKKGQVVDHINQNKLDNRKYNLRFTTHSMNKINQKSIITNTSGYTGVVKRKDPRYKRKTWMAYVKIDGKEYWLGHYKTPEEASQARKEFLKMRGIYFYEGDYNEN